MDAQHKVRLPLSRTRRSQATYAKLLKRADYRSRSPFRWDGKFLSPGTWIPEASLWPDGEYPRVPLLVEFAGADNPARGWKRHESDETVVLWRYDRERKEFIEVGRVQASRGLWAPLLEPLVRHSLAEYEGERPEPQIDVIRDRIGRFLQAELDVIAEHDRARILCMVHDELAARIAEWSSDSAQLARFGEFLM